MSFKQNAPLKPIPSKVQKAAKGPPIPRQPFSRMNFLYQASLLLSLPSISNPPGSSTSVTQLSAPYPNPALSRFYLSTLKTVSQKNVLRLHPSMKRSICKRCDTHLVPGVSCTVFRENKSKGGKKPWAEIIVVECRGCKAMKRFPVGKGKGWGSREEAGGIGLEGDGEGVGEDGGYTLWCDRADVVEGEVVGGGGSGGAPGQVGSEGK